MLFEQQTSTGSEELPDDVVKLLDANGNVVSIEVSDLYII